LEQHQDTRTAEPPALGPAPRCSSQLDAFEMTIQDLLGRYPDITV
jgi:hypothetical protein